MNASIRYYSSGAAAVTHNFNVTIFHRPIHFASPHVIDLNGSEIYENGLLLL